MTLGFIGLGRMGSRMAGKLLAEKHDLVVWNRSPGPAEDLLAEHRAAIEARRAGQLNIAASLSGMVAGLAKPRVVWIMLPAGEPTESMIKNLAAQVEEGDILIDGGNAHFKDTERRYQELTAGKIKFLGIGVSGGIIAEKQGYPLMAGGDQRAYAHIRPILDSLARPAGGHAYFGIGGAGHFVKMVHNGIEYGIMQSLGEGFAVLQKAPYPIDLTAVARLYQRGTLVSGFMLDRGLEVLERDASLADIKGIIAETGEARWMIDQAAEEGVDVEIIACSLEYRRRSQSDGRIQESYAARFVAALRNAFGGHEVQKQVRSPNDG